MNTKQRLAGWLSALLLFALLFTGCTKEDNTDTPKSGTVTIQIDYLGDGGYYTDNISTVPTGLIIGSNGPYSLDLDQAYTIEYQANSTFPVLTKEWTPTASGSYTIHCYVVGNTEYLSVDPN